MFSGQSTSSFASLFTSGTERVGPIIASQQRRDTTPPAALHPYEPLAQDGVIAAWESNRAIHLRGRAEQEPGATVTLSFNGESWHSTVNHWGYWHATMPPSVLQGVADGNHSLTLTITDKAGNSTATEVGFGVYVDKTLRPEISVAPVSGDNAISVAEGIYGVEVSGQVTHMPLNSHVTLKLGNKSTTALVDEHGAWQATFTPEDLHALPDGVYQLQVSARDPNGKTSTVQHELTLITHPESLPHISFDSVTADNVINFAESQQDLMLSGTLSALAPGQKLELCVGDKVYHAAIDAQGHWQTIVPASEVSNFISLGEVRVYALDAAGNSTDTTLGLNVVTTLPEIYCEMNIGGDTFLNAQEAQQPLSFYLEGVNQLTLNGKAYTPVDGMVTLSVADLQALPDGPVSAMAERWDSYGNHDSQTLSDLFTVAIHQLPSLTLQQPFGDGVIASGDMDHWHLIQGSSDHLTQGSLVTVTLGDRHYSAAVDESGEWSLTILAGQLATLEPGSYQMSVSAQDKAGNLASAVRTVTVEDAGSTDFSATTIDSLLAHYGAGEAIPDAAAAGSEPDHHYGSSDAAWTLADHLQQQPVAALV